MNEVVLRTNGVRTLVLDIRDVEDVVPYKYLHSITVGEDIILPNFCKNNTKALLTWAYQKFFRSPYGI